MHSDPETARDHPALTRQPTDFSNDFTHQLFEHLKFAAHG